jgi:hypothetical protein
VAQLTEACTMDGCPFHGTIEDLDRAVFKGNGSPALTVQISNLSTKISTTQKLILAECVIVPAAITIIELLFRLGK